MRIVLLLSVLSSLIGFGQSDKSLLWEISGNGLQQTSYLYGTMHVSKRIAFRLDDVFFEALDQSAVIALESDPDTWLEEESTMGNMGYAQLGRQDPKGFYVYPFIVQNPKKEEISAMISFEDSRINSLLYRTNGYAQDLEEETYLDMFIYQAGKKFGKKVMALEDLEESSALVGRASMNAMKQKPDDWLLRKMQEKDVLTLLQDAYRDRDIEMLDSIDKAIYTEHYRKNMLVTRNQHMVAKLELAMQNAKTFAGIGAAHLPGKMGVLALLREKGYTVKPLVSKASQQGKNLKEKIESALLVHSYQTVGPDDALFSIGLPNKLYPISDYVNTTYISPDLANGSYVMLNRIPTFGYLKKDELYTLDDIDKLLFESVPGKVLEKSRITRDGVAGIEVKNQLKNGDYQRYHIYLTPLEILIFKMGGKGDYVQVYSDTIFNSIGFKKLEKTWTTIATPYHDFEIKMPAIHSFANQNREGDRLAQGYDESSDSYYFLRKNTLNDFNTIEEDSFELKQIQKRFYQDLKLSAQYGEINGNTLQSSAVLDAAKGTYLHLKGVITGNDYYLMGAVTKDAPSANAYFNSFKTNPAKYQEKFETVKDTALFFTTVTSVKPLKFVENSNNYYNGESKPKAYGAYSKKSVYRNKNNETVAVEVNKSHDFLMFPSIDSVWALRKKIYADKRFTITQEKKKEMATGQHQLELMLTDTASARGILIKNIVKDGLLFELKTSIDTLVGPSRFIMEFFDNFKPMDTVIGKSILIDKTPLFFEALRRNDSIMNEGYTFIKFGRQHIDSLKYYIAKFEFPADKMQIQAHLIQKLAQFDDPSVTAFFKTLYLQSYHNSRAQSLILSSIAKNADSKAVKLLLELMAKDLPLAANTIETHNIFKPFKDSLPLAKQLYPHVLDYSAIEEYKAPIFAMLASLKSANIIKAKSYKKFRRQILNDAKIQLKRQLGKATHNFEPYMNGNLVQGVNGNGVSVLQDYAILLYPFIEEKEVALFFDRLAIVQDPNIRTTLAVLHAIGEESIPEGLLSALASQIDGRLQLYMKLKAIGKHHLFPEKYQDQRYLAESILYDRHRFNLKTDSLTYLTQKPLNFRGKELTGYFFKTMRKSDYDKNYNMHLVVLDNRGGWDTKPFYLGEEIRIEDTDTDHDVIEYVAEAFLLKDRPRAIVYRPNMLGRYAHYGF